MDRGLYNNRINNLIASLLVVTAIACCMVFYQKYYIMEVPNNSQLFYVWNLLLCWIPFMLSFMIFRRYLILKKKDIVGVLLGGVWLLFYPNSIYILTDFLHLDRISHIFVGGPDGGQTVVDVALWFEFSMVSLFILIGFIMGMVSLYFVHYVVNTLYGHAMGWIVTTLIIILSTYAIYLGRVYRSNSWYIVTRPMSLIKDILDSFNQETFLFMGVLTILFLCLYLLFYQLLSMFKSWH